MHRLNLIRLIGAALLGCAAGALAQQALEIIPLRHRTVEQVLPALQPLLEPGATLSGNRGQLFLRASPGNAADIKRALEVIDRPSRRLQISVRFDDAQESERRRLGVQGAIGTGGARINVTAEDSRASAGERVDQRLQVLEGSEATIFTGQTGMQVRPRLSGNQVFLDVAPQRPTQRIVTTINARLGEWVELGANEARRTWVKVEELPN